MTVRWCPECRARAIAAASDAGVCERCERLRRVADVVFALTLRRVHPESDAAKLGQRFDWPELVAPEAVAVEMLRAPALARRRHNRELRDEQREAQRAASDAFAEGRAEERASHGDW